MKTGFTMVCALAGLLGVHLSTATAQDADATPAPYDLTSLECGELDSDAGYRPLRPSHIAGEDLDILCKVTVGLPAKTKGTPKAHTVKLTVGQTTKVGYEQVRDARVLNAGSRVILFVIPAEKLPTEAGKVTIRAELSRPVNKPGFKEQSFTLTAED
jgi:hypothetical protein